jgi:hypothetical protein
MIQWLETAKLAEHEAPRKALPLRRRRTGRNYQLLLKVKPEAAARVTTLADAEGVCFGELLEHMLAVYEVSRKRKDR